MDMEKVAVLTLKKNLLTKKKKLSTKLIMNGLLGFVEGLVEHQLVVRVL